MKQTTDFSVLIQSVWGKTRANIKDLFIPLVYIYKHLQYVQGAVKGTLVKVRCVIPLKLDSVGDIR